MYCSIDSKAFIFVRNMCTEFEEEGLATWVGDSIGWSSDVQK